MALRTLLLVLPAVLTPIALAWWFWPDSTRTEATSKTETLDTLTSPKGPLRVYHLGHSLVGRDMPAMLAQLADEGHHYDRQLGWGTSLKEHWEPGLKINGFKSENDHPRFRPAKPAIGSGEYDVVVLTEMVELRDAIKYHDSADYLARWSALAHRSSPETRVYLYETWHRLDDADGWLERLDSDLNRYWQDKLLLPAAAETGMPIHLIPAGQVMARLVRKIEAAGGVGGLNRREDLFLRDENGALDQIHLNDMGAYLIALTHYAVLYHRSPVGLPHQLTRADGTPIDTLSPEAARLMQETVWEVVTTDPRTGVAK